MSWNVLRLCNGYFKDMLILSCELKYECSQLQVDWIGQLRTANEVAPTRRIRICSTIVTSCTLQRLPIVEHCISAPEQCGKDACFYYKSSSCCDKRSAEYGSDAYGTCGTSSAPFAVYNRGAIV